MPSDLTLWALASLGAVDINPGHIRAANSYGIVHHNKMGVPHLTLVRDPATPVEEAVEALEQATPDGRHMRRLLARHDPDLPQVDPATGEVYLNGRACCYQLSVQVSERLALLAVPSDHRCDSCGSVWRLVHRVRNLGGR